ncbi:unnamed protein product [Pleuronectes platessa]|uniref:RIB43A-like with coiled-coils protein 1 n=1 Tax=Pleuronectes platessa TaxID=8262 RepID=A0A9N7VH10_PLEPL|nr:unnamed protein product [Pleuronectes platessa]
MKPVQGPLETVNMYKVDFPVDQSAEKAVERRRSAESARKARIFNTRLRVMGLDTDVLNQQVQEKKHQQNIERQRDKAFDKLREYHDVALLQLETDDREKRAALHTDLVQYWATQQRVEDSRDADLKCGLQGAFRIPIPERRGYRRGASEERTNERDRKRSTSPEGGQCERHMGNKHREMLVSRELVHQDLRGVQQAALEEECKNAIRIAYNDYNRALAAEQAEKLMEQHRREERENLAEMRHTLTSDMMTECAEAAERKVGGGKPHHVLTDRWRGMSPEQLRAVHEERETQCRERQRKRDAEKIHDTALDLQLLKLSREAEEEEARAAELKRQTRIQMDQYNMQLAREQQAHQEYLDKKLYTNKPTRDYFYQFNTSSR